MLTVSIPMKIMGFWSLIFYKDTILPWKTKSSDPIPINGRSCTDLVHETEVQGFSFCSQECQNPKVCLTVPYLLCFVFYFHTKAMLIIFFCFFVISVLYNISGNIMLLMHSNSIHVTILVLEQPYFTFWLLSCCNASSCTYQFIWALQLTYAWRLLN